MPPIVQQLSIVAYRGIRDLALSNLTPVTLIIGANNSGKSSILESVAVLLRPTDPGQWIGVVRGRDVDIPPAQGMWAMFPAIRPAATEPPVRNTAMMVLEATVSGIRRDVMAGAMIRSTYGGEAEPLKPFVDVNLVVDRSPSIELSFPSSREVRTDVQMFRVFLLTAALHYATKTLVSHLGRVVKEGKKHLVVELLKVFDRDVTDIDVIDDADGVDGVELLVTHAIRGVVDLSSFGDGMRRAAALAIGLARASDGVLLVDEIEAGIHHTILASLLSKFLAAAAISRTQIIATTHSLEAIDAMIECTQASPPDADSTVNGAEWTGPERLSAFWLKRTGDKHEVRRYGHKQLQTLREGGLDIR